MTCTICGKARQWVGYKTGIGKSPAQLADMQREATTCVFCGSSQQRAALSEQGLTQHAMSELVKCALESIIPREQSMRALLATAEEELPKLLRDGQMWNSMYVEYHKPYVERLWRPLREGRVYLHKVHTCGAEEALFHPHPWPSAMKILRGGYEMGMGHGSGNVAPPISVTVQLEAGSIYEMAHPDGWHYVRPIGEANFSVMVSGMPWKRGSPKGEGVSRPLTAAQEQELLEFFKAVY
jgi:hypothetical protein